MNWTIRAMTEADYGVVRALWERTEGVGLNESDTPEMVGSFLRRNAGLSVVAEDGEGRIGGAVLCGHDGRRGYLHHLAVEQAWRRQGIGKGLVTQCLSRLKGEGIAKCNLFLYANNAAGEMFWLGNGWKVRGDLKMVQKDVR